VTPVFIAALHGHAKVIAELAKHDIDLNQTEKSGLTPAHIAAIKGHANVMNELQKHVTQAAFIASKNQYAHAMIQLTLTPVMNSLTQLHGECHAGCEALKSFCSEIFKTLTGVSNMNKKIEQLNVLLNNMDSATSVTHLHPITPLAQETMRTMVNALADASANPQALEHAVAALDDLSSTLHQANLNNQVPPTNP